MPNMTFSFMNNLQKAAKCAIIARFKIKHYIYGYQIKSMNINLSDASKQKEVSELTLELTDRLPEHIQAPCSIVLRWRLERIDDFYLLYLTFNADLQPICQRCLESFDFVMNDEHVLAICENEQRAEQLMMDYEVITADRGQVDLVHIVTDELHFSAPVFHPESDFCGHE